MTPTCELLVRVGGGDRAAFAALYDATCGPAYRLARCLAGDAEGAEDLLRCGYLEAWRTASRFDPTCDRALAWLLGLVQACAREAHSSPSAAPVGAMAERPATSRP